MKRKKGRSKARTEQNSRPLSFSSLEVLRHILVYLICDLIPGNTSSVLEDQMTPTDLSILKRVPLRPPISLLPWEWIIACLVLNGGKIVVVFPFIFCRLHS